MFLVEGCLVCEDDGVEKNVDVDGYYMVIYEDVVVDNVN